MNSDFAYQAWMALSQFASHPEIEDRKQRIVDRTLEQIAQATLLRDVEALLQWRRSADVTCPSSGTRANGLASKG
ncbi:MAG: hypothetical protein O2968_05240 [Acidobacteria bacterium]|nr:hypothetical protein [Acidobacteriota bacterium]